jgi:redox-regulated HSP33 family molecular chaperone
MLSGIPFDLTLNEIMGHQKHHFAVTVANGLQVQVLPPGCNRQYARDDSWWFQHEHGLIEDLNQDRQLEVPYFTRLNAP